MVYACSNGNFEIVKHLMEKHGADVNKENDNGITPLFFACNTGNFEIVKYLVEHGADVNREEDRDERTPLFNACRTGNLNIVKYLVEEHGADVNREEDRDERTPLFYASKRGNLDFEACNTDIEVVEILLLRRPRIPGRRSILQTKLRDNLSIDRISLLTNQLTASKSFDLQRIDHADLKSELVKKLSDALRITTG